MHLFYKTLEVSLPIKYFQRPLVILSLHFLLPCNWTDNHSSLLCFFVIKFSGSTYEYNCACYLSYGKGPDLVLLKN